MNPVFILGALFIFIILAFVCGMLFMPELFGISKDVKPDATTEKEKKTDL